MAHDYQKEGWPASVNGTHYTFTYWKSCDQGDTGLMYKVNNGQNPHITIHNLNHAGPTDWLGFPEFHIAYNAAQGSQSRLFEYVGAQPSAFSMPNKKGKGRGKKTTNSGSGQQVATNNLIAEEFYNGIRS